MEQALTGVSDGRGVGGEPRVAFLRGGGVGGKEGAEDGVSDKARVGAIYENMGGEFAVGGAVYVPTDVAECAGGPAFAAAFVANRARVKERHVKGVSGGETNVW